MAWLDSDHSLSSCPPGGPVAAVVVAGNGAAPGRVATGDRPATARLIQTPVSCRREHQDEGRTAMQTPLTRHLQLGSVRDMDWLTAHFGHR
jgi:hypothetical protein